MKTVILNGQQLTKDRDNFKKTVPTVPCLPKHIGIILLHT